MNQKTNPIRKLTIEELLNKDQYIIPIYQRNYSWGNDEIEALLTDLVKAYERNATNYYIGSLVVYRQDSKFEVIDGQQRLTTFTLIKAFFQKKGIILDRLKSEYNLSFEHRKSSTSALKNLHKNDTPPNFKNAMKAIEGHWKNLIGKKNEKEIATFILQKVKIIRTEVPPETNLNHYFEIMNTRGEQLEKHEILKARFMGRLQELERNKPEVYSTFAHIWDACSDMERYMIMGFEPNIRKHIFSNTWQKLSDEFNKITDCFKDNTYQECSKNLKNKPTIKNILNKAFKLKNNQNIESHNKPERFNSVIDFPNFLLHVLRIYWECKNDLLQAKNINLDDKNLLDSIKINSFTIKDIKIFALVLLQCRYLFDCYIIKSDTLKEQENHWVLWKIKAKNNQIGYLFNNQFDNNKQNQQIVMLLSMFHVLTHLEFIRTGYMQYCVGYMKINPKFHLMNTSNF